METGASGSGIGFVRAKNTALWRCFGVTRISEFERARSQYQHDIFIASPQVLIQSANFEVRLQNYSIENGPLLQIPVFPPARKRHRVRARAEGRGKQSTQLRARLAMPQETHIAFPVLIPVVEVASDKSVPQVVARWGPQPTLCTAFGEDGIALARKNGRVEVLNPSSGVRLAEIGVPTSTATDGSNGKSREDASDAVCGLHLFKKTSAWGTAVLTCTEQGVVAIQRIHCRDEDEDMGVSTCGDEDMGVSTSSPADAVVWSVADSGCILCLRVDGSERYALFGGKGVDVSLWDLEKRTRLWSAKNPRRDNLGLIAPAYVTALAFLSDKDHNKFVVGTGHHQIRLYDTTGSQRRPVMMFDYGESPIKSIAPDGDGYTVYVGTGSGDLGCFDMRTGQNVGGFKGKIAGSVRSVVRHPTLPLVASCGLDRYLRIHHSKTRQLLAMLFLKQQLVSVVFDTSALSVLPASESADKEPAVKTSVNGEEKASLPRPVEEITVNGNADKKRSRKDVNDSPRPSKNGMKIKKPKGKVSNSEDKQERSSKKCRK